MVTRNSLEKSNCTHKSTHIFYFFCYGLSASLIEVPRRGAVSQQRNENVSYNFFVIVPHKGYQLQVLFLQCVEANGCKVFAWELVFIHVCHIAPLVLRQKEMKEWRSLQHPLGRWLRVAYCLTTNSSFLTQDFPIWNTCSLSSGQRQPLTQSWHWYWIS